MENDRQLVSVMIGTEWQGAVAEMQAWQWTLKDQAQYYAGVLRQRVLMGTCSLDDLRGGVAWTNALDAESVHKGVTVDMSSEDGVEAMSRRLAHQAGQIALNSLKSRTKRSNAFALHAQLSRADAARKLYRDQAHLRHYNQEALWPIQ